MAGACVELHQPAVVIMVSGGGQEFTLCLGEGVLRPFLQCTRGDVQQFLLNYRYDGRAIINAEILYSGYCIPY